MRGFGHPRTADVMRVLSVVRKGGKVQEITKVCFLMFPERIIDSNSFGFIKSKTLKEAGWILKYGSLYRMMTSGRVLRHIGRTQFMFP